MRLIGFKVLMQMRDFKSLWSSADFSSRCYTWKRKQVAENKVSNQALFCVAPVNSELLLVVRRPGCIILLRGIVGFMQKHIHQLEVNWPVDLQVNCLLLLLE